MNAFYLYLRLFEKKLKYLNEQFFDKLLKCDEIAAMIKQDVLISFYREIFLYLFSLLHRDNVRSLVLSDYSPRKTTSTFASICTKYFFSLRLEKSFETNI